MKKKPRIIVLIFLLLIIVFNIDFRKTETIKVTNNDVKSFKYSQEEKNDIIRELDSSKYSHNLDNIIVKHFVFNVPTQIKMTNNKTNLNIKLLTDQSILSRRTGNKTYISNGPYIDDDIMTVYNEKRESLKRQEFILALIVIPIFLGIILALIYWH